MRPAETPPDQRSGTPWTWFPSPLRYPGGKLKLAPFVKLLIETNGLMDGNYAEVYAGGAAVALSVLYEGYVRRIHINDVDAAVHAFWSAALNETDELVRRVRDADLSMDEWHRQRAIVRSGKADPIDLGYAALYLNRTNRSGILTGGPIGGYAQRGPWRLDARFRRDDLIHRIQKVGRHREQIALTRLDASEFLTKVVPTLPERCLVYLDPPYFVKGQEELYANSYRPDDHRDLATLVRSLERPWMVSYDDVPTIRELYDGHTLVAYGIPYAAQARYRGREIAFFSTSLDPPAVLNPVRITRHESRTIRAAATF